MCRSFTVVPLGLDIERLKGDPTKGPPVRKGFDRDVPDGTGLLVLVLVRTR